MDAVRDPLEDLAELIHRDRRWIAIAAFAAAFVHVAIALGVRRTRFPGLAPLVPRPTEVIDIELPTPPAAWRAPITPPNPTADAPPKRASRASASVPIPAQAATVLTRSSSAEEPLDLTSNGFVVGSSATYAGGQTSPTGTSGGAWHRGAPPMAGGPSATSATAGPGPDLSRPASAMGGTAWQCPFPAEADATRIDEATVTLRVVVDPEGTVKRVTVLGDPGHGFGREAQRCATLRHWNPALDLAGHAVEGTVTIRVHFDR